MWTSRYLSFNVLSLNQFLVRQKYYLSYFNASKQTNKTETKLCKTSNLEFLHCTNPNKNPVKSHLLVLLFFYHCLQPPWRRKGRPAWGSPWKDEVSRRLLSQQHFNTLQKSLEASRLCIISFLALAAFIMQLVYLVMKYFPALFFVEAIPCDLSICVFLISLIIESIKLSNLTDSV